MDKMVAALESTKDRVHTIKLVARFVVVYGHFYGNDAIMCSKLYNETTPSSLVVTLNPFTPESDQV